MVATGRWLVLLAGILAGVVFVEIALYLTGRSTELLLLAMLVGLLGGVSLASYDAMAPFAAAFMTGIVGWALLGFLIGVGQGLTR